MENVSIEYLAGFFDGEGCISCRKTKKAIYIEIGNTNPNILLFYKKKFNGHIYKQKVNKNANQVKIWYLYTIMKKCDVLHFLIEISPYLVEKKSQALLAIDFLKKYIDVKITDTVNDEYSNFLEKMKELKNVEYEDFTEF